jgi:hypothetical protein
MRLTIISILLALGFNALASVPYVPIRVNFEDEDPQFEIPGKVLNTPIIRAFTFQGTNVWNPTGYNAYLSFGEDNNVTNMVVVTGVCYSTYIDFQIRSNEFARPVTRWYCSVMCTMPSIAGTYSIGYGYLNIKAAPEVNANGSFFYTRAINGSEYGPFTGSFTNWPFALKGDYGGYVSIADYIIGTNLLQTQITANLTNQNSTNTLLQNQITSNYTNQNATNTVIQVQVTANLTNQANTNSGFNGRFVNLEAYTNAQNSTNAALLGRIVDIETAAGTLRIDLTSASNALVLLNGVTLTNLNTVSNVLRLAVGAVQTNLNTVSNVFNLATNNLSERMILIEGATSLLNIVTANLIGATNALNSSITNLNNASNALNTRAASLESAVITANTRIGNLESSSNALNTRATNLESATNALGVRSANLESATNILNTRAGSLEGATNILNLATNALNTKDTSLASATNALNTRSANLEGATNVLNTTANSLIVSTNALNTRMGAVEGYTTETHTAYGWGSHASAGYLTATNPIYPALTVANRSYLDTNIAGLTRSVYTGVVASTIGYTGATVLVVGRIYTWGYSHVGYGTSILALAGTTLGTNTAVANYSNYFTYAAGSNLTLTLSGTAAGLGYATNIYVCEITNGDFAAVSIATKTLTVNGTNYTDATSHIAATGTNVHGLGTMALQSTNDYTGTVALAASAMQSLPLTNDLMGATNALNTRTGNLESATNALNTRSGNLEGATNALNTRAGSLESATNALNTRAGNLEGSTNVINIVANAALPRSGGTMTGALLTDSITATAPSSNELVTASWARDLLSDGFTLYNNTNLQSVAFANPCYSLYSTTQDAMQARQVVVTGVNHYVSTVCSTQRFTQLRGPITVKAYLSRIGGSGPTLALSVAPEIYYIYDTNTTDLLGDYGAGSQAIGYGTNLYTWAIPVPSLVSTNETGFYIVRRYKVTAVSGNTLPSFGITAGGEYESFINVVIPNLSATGLDHTQLFNQNGNTNFQHTTALERLALTNYIPAATNLLNGATNILNTRAGNLEAATNALNVRAGNLESSTNDLSIRTIAIEGASNYINGVMITGATITASTVDAVTVSGGNAAFTWNTNAAGGGGAGTITNMADDPVTSIVWTASGGPQPIGSVTAYVARVAAPTNYFTWQAGTNFNFTTNGSGVLEFNTPSGSTTNLAGLVWDAGATTGTLHILNGHVTVSVP